MDTRVEHAEVLAGVVHPVERASQHPVSQAALAEVGVGDNTAGANHTQSSTPDSDRTEVEAGVPDKALSDEDAKAPTFSSPGVAETHLLWTGPWGV
jgi:hypothetical protein